MTGNFTLDGFEHSISGKGVGGDGFLSRMVLEYSEGINYEGDWEPINADRTNPALKGIKDSLQFIYQTCEDKKESAIPRFIPEEDLDAKAERAEFQKWLVEQKKDIEKTTPGASYAARIESHFKRDLLIRVIFSPERRITKDAVIRSILWAKHQLTIRQMLWPVDRGNDIEKCEKRIMKAIRAYGPLTKAGIQNYSRAESGSGGFNAWNPAWTNILQSGYVSVLPYKTRKKQDVFGLRDYKWDRELRKWDV
jgi:hypothetical protein